MAPEFMLSGYYHPDELNPYMSDDAPEKFKEEFEEYENDAGGYALLKELHPEMKSPYRRWNGEVIDLDK